MTDTMVTALPNAQTGLDLFKDRWFYNIPVPETKTGGWHYGGSDIQTMEHAVSLLGGSLAGFDVLELGPHEAELTYKTASYLPASITSIEGRPHNFLKCLVAANALGLRSKFMLGDFTKFLKQCDRRYDLLLMCGVLYHQTNPLELIELCCHVADRMVIVSHYFDYEKVLTAAKVGGAHWALPNGATGERHTHKGYTCEYFRHEYVPGPGHDAGSGGLTGYAHFLRQSDILGAIRHFGHTVLHDVDSLDHMRGPHMTAVTRRN